MAKLRGYRALYEALDLGLAVVTPYLFIDPFSVQYMPGAKFVLKRPDPQHLPVKTYLVGIWRMRDVDKTPSDVFTQPPGWPPNFYDYGRGFPTVERWLISNNCSRVWILGQHNQQIILHGEQASGLEFE